MTSNRESVAQRTTFMGLGAPSAAYLSIGPLLREALPEALNAFYDRVRATPETRRFFRDESHITAASTAQQGHWAAIIEGRTDEAYAGSVRTIGQVHARIGLEPQWYIGGYSVLLAHLIQRVTQRPRRWMQKQAEHDRITAQAVAELSQRVMLDMDLAISTYLDALAEQRDRSEAARSEAEAQQARVVALVGQALTGLSHGDLASTVEAEFPESYLPLKQDFNAAVSRLNQTMAVVTDNVGAIHASADEITQAADDLSRRTEQQAASLEETAAALDQITATVNRTASGAGQASEVVQTARGDAEASDRVVGLAVEAMGTIEKSAQEISQIIGVIDEIAFQTNLLALNAGVEAARAGDAGRGFAVVASEVRALAQRSAEAAKEIKTLITASSAQVACGVDMVGQTGQALRRIVDRIAEIDGLVSEIAASAREQAIGLGEINTAINQMDHVTQQNAAMVEQTTAASHALSQQAESLGASVGRFRLESPAAGALRRAA